MRFKYYLRGLGLGILFSVIIMAISIHFHKNELVSDQEVISRAKELGMIMGDAPENSEADQTEQDQIDSEKLTEQVDKIIEQEQDVDDSSDKPLDDIVSKEETVTTEIISATENQEAAENIENTDALKTTEASETTENLESEADKPLSYYNNVDYVIINVKSGDVPRDVANKLKEYKIIEDSDDFRHYVGRKSGRVLMVGEYKIPKNASYDEIIKIMFRR